MTKFVNMWYYSDKLFKSYLLERGWEEFNSERLSAIFHNISDYETRRRMSERAQKTIHSDGALYAAAQIVSFLNGEGGE